MARMVRKQVYLGQEQDRVLKLRARERGVTEAQVIRDALDGPGYGVRASTKAPGDPVAARKALAFMRSLTLRRRKTPTGRNWTRESLYEERLGRWPKS